MTIIKENRRAVIFIFITVLLDTISLGIILPVTPGLIMQLGGVDLSRAAEYGGWLWFLYAFTQFFCAPLLGGLSDRYGRRPVLLFALAAFGIDYLIMGFAPALSWLFVGRAIAGIAGASYVPAYAYLADITPPEKRAQNFGLIGAAFGAGFVLGPALGGLLAHFGTRTPFFAASAAALLNLCFGYFTLPETLAPESRRAFEWKRANPLGTLLQMRKYPSVLGMAAALLIWQIGHQVFPSTWSFYTMLKFGWTPTMVGGSLAFVGVIMAIGQGYLPRVLVPALGGERKVVLLGFAVAAVSFTAYAFATRGWMMYAIMLTWMFSAPVYACVNALMSRQVPASAQGELQGGVGSLGSLSAIIGPILMTQLFGHFSNVNATPYFPGIAFFAAALLTLASFVVFSRSAPSAAAPASESTENNKGLSS